MKQNTYAELLKEQGYNVIEEDSVFWFGYQGFMMPAYLPHRVPAISKETALKVLKKSSKPFVRWDENFNQITESQWWYIVKRGHWDIADVKDKKKRWMIRQGKKNFTVRPLTYDETVMLCPEVAQAAAARYKGKAEIETTEILAKRTEAAKKVPDVLEYLGCFHNEKLVSFSESYIQDNAVWLAIIRHNPKHLNKYSSYGFMDGILEYYLNEKKFDYVLDGSRSIHHKTQFQSHLIKVFGFTKEYANLNVVYSNLFGVMVKTAYPFRKVFEKISEKLDNNFITNISAVLKQEYIKRATRQHRG